MMPESAWKWGGYRYGFGKGEFTHYRIMFAVAAIKNELMRLGFGDDLNPTSPIFGGQMKKAVKAFQQSEYLLADGVAGQKTCNALWRDRIERQNVPDGWERAQIHWESADDPGAEFTNPDGSRDRGLSQLNSAKPIPDEDAFNPAYSIPFLGGFLKGGAAAFAGCKVDKWRLAVGRWRTPVGAEFWCDHPDVVPNKDGDSSARGWAEKAAYYVDRVDTSGRLGWVG